MPKKTTTTSKNTVKKEKVVKKPIAKKTVKKTTKTDAEKITKSKSSKNSKVKEVKVMVYANGEQSFWTNNGQVLDSLIALHQALNDMDKEVFSYHVDGDKNDFADWVEYVLCDGDCAKDLRKTKTPTKACSVVEKHLKTYKA